MYFQRKYINESFMSIYSELVNSAASQILALKKENVGVSFYGEDQPPLSGNDLVEGNSLPSANEDLFGYYEIYQNMPVGEFLESLTANDFKELSPPQVLFLLEFHLQEVITEHQELEMRLVYSPHCFYHRYARSIDENDRMSSATKFANSLRNISSNDKLPFPAYLCRIQQDGSHAFATIRDDLGRWILLDSLVGSGVLMESVDELFKEEKYGGRASVLMVEDQTRSRITLATKLIADH